MSREQNPLLSPEQEAFLAKARRLAYKDEFQPDKRRYLKAYRRFMAEAEANGIMKIDPLLLGDHYEIARDAARRRKKAAS